MIRFKPSPDFRCVYAPLALFASLLAVLFVAKSAHNVDFEHMGRPIRAFVEGNWSNIYPASTPGTSPTGWVLLSGIPVLFFRLFVDFPEAYALANLLVLPALLFASRYTLRAFWTEASSASVWLLAAISVWLPTTLGAYVNAYHPQDLAAVVLIVWALGLLHKQKMLEAGVVFGLAVMTRQWALLALLPAVGFTRNRGFWRFIIPVGVVGIVLTAPVVLAGGNAGWVTAFSSSSVNGTGDTIFGLLQKQGGIENAGSGGADTVLLVARLLPLLLSLAIGVYVWARKLTAPQHLIAAVIFGLASRMIFDVSNYMYYWVPFAVLFVLLVPYRKIAWFAVAFFALAPWAVDTLLPTLGTVTLGKEDTLSIDQAHRTLRSVATLVMALAAPFVALVIVTSTDDPDAAVSGNEEKSATEFPAVGALWGLVLLLWVAGFGLLISRPDSIEPIREIKSITESQIMARDMLANEGVDVGTGKVGRLP